VYSKGKMVLRYCCLTAGLAVVTHFVLDSIVVQKNSVKNMFFKFCKLFSVRLMAYFYAQFVQYIDVNHSCFEQYIVNFKNV